MRTENIHAESRLSHPIDEFFGHPTTVPLLLCGDALATLKMLPAESVDCCMTSPPYWGQRQYSEGEMGIGLEATHIQYIRALALVFSEVYRTLKPTGSFWLNLGDSYLNKNLLGLPWRVAFSLVDEQGWILRNSVVWNKVKGGPDNTIDRLRTVHENVFHFVKHPKKYFYDADAIRKTPQKSKLMKGVIVSATGVSGVRYKRQIELSTVQTQAEKQMAFAALNNLLREMEEGKLSDFRMIIRGQQRTTHSDSNSVSGRAREIQEKGFYFLKYHPKGCKPSDVWDILPEDSQKRSEHFAAYPEDLCRIPIQATSPENGIVLDPFCGTGTTMLVAHRMRRRSIGIDLSESYIRLAQERCSFLL